VKGRPGESTSLGFDVVSQYYVNDDRIEIRGNSGIIWMQRAGIDARVSSSS